MTRTGMETHLHMKKSSVNNLLRLLSLPQPLQAMVRNKELPQAKARALAGLRELGLPREELHDLMQELAASTTPGETCAAFHNRIQEYKAKRKDVPRNRHTQGQKARTECVESHVQKLLSMLRRHMITPEYAADVLRMLQPLHQRITAILDQATPDEQESPDEKGNDQQEQA